MEFTLSNEFMKCLGEIEKETNGSWFCNVEEKSQREREKGDT